MKNILNFGLLLLLTIIPSKSFSQKDLKGTITISGAFALYPLTVRWAEEFKKTYPQVRIDISAGGAGKGITDVLAGMVDIAMVSREIKQVEIEKGAFTIDVVRDAVVPTFSEKNPVCDEILKKGIKQHIFKEIFINGRVSTWGVALGKPNGIPLRAYTRSDACGAAESWASYIGIQQEDLLGIGVFSDPGIATSVIKDPCAIGYNNVGYAYDATTKYTHKGLKIVPIDINNNGIIDADENFYENLNDLIKAIADGRYPSPPAHNLYFATKNKPTSKIVIEFIKWSLTEGQKYVYEAGYVNLNNEILNLQLQKIK